ncbi:hypothetical protein XELAEV_18039888mg [Xenopus laevis]|uniref:Uncharacterized protein n=1 Tax=Xenopus laevis TaxID=8355 RepID=A0A974C8L2_XENLA|nr:hypothetical protein XELAEV_18039888mg [Xenopus laevis]
MYSREAPLPPAAWRTERFATSSEYGTRTLDASYTESLGSLIMFSVSRLLGQTWRQPEVVGRNQAEQRPQWPTVRRQTQEQLPLHYYIRGFKEISFPVGRKMCNSVSVRVGCGSDWGTTLPRDSQIYRRVRVKLHCSSQVATFKCRLLVL